MTGQQRWFLTTPEQYAAAPVGTQVQCTWTVAEKTEDCWRVRFSRWPILLRLPIRRKVIRWGVDADHQRACAAIWLLNARQRTALHVLTDQEATNLLDAHVTAYDIVRLRWPAATDEECRYVLWELTPWPMVQGVHDLADAIADIEEDTPPRQTEVAS